ncbi:SRPBCC domain-containing protein [filamentous cyanobacterium LEGE 11480]|uniref:SRPBCC domain-containing protein n=1 Tax=Romeriopsis navalis LEGE 11480 TaxID=2777977 RepID=A0A928VN27_9CYAN|nr:SRPBCC domain-containing protein [Romeriopsis navalis]MBE9030642.1 SRPBCC domain-containing protein [Romeriopsis navalis LEGE 11480]
MVQTPNAPTFKQRMALRRGWTVSIDIHAPRALVWEQVTDFAAYAEWNPFVLEAEAEFEVGKSIQFLEELQEFGQHWLAAKFLAIDPPNEFVWQGHFKAALLFQVRHSFKFEALGNHRTRFTQVHQHSGILIPYLAWKGIYIRSHQGYMAFNQALKRRCEELAAARSV